MTKQNRKLLSPRFYCSPDEFSFKDLLAVIFTVGFFYFCYHALAEKQALELVKSIAYLMAVILGGYFGQEITVAISKEKYRNQQALMNSFEGDGGETGNKGEHTDQSNSGSQYPI